MRAALYFNWRRQRTGDRRDSSADVKLYEGKINDDPAISLTLLALTIGLPIVFYHLILLEQKRSIFSGSDAFLASASLRLSERIIFVTLFSVESLLLLVTATAIVRMLLPSVAAEHRWAQKLIAGSVCGAYAAAITIEFKVLEYFRDGLDLISIRSFGGGNPSTALAYIEGHVRALFPRLALPAVLLLGLGWLLRQYSYRSYRQLARLRVVRAISTPTGLIYANGILMAAPLLLVSAAYSLDYALSFSIAHRIFASPIRYLGDFDGDGYGIAGPHFDFAPFDKARHPYAIEIPGNGVDENGLGGDLQSVSYRDPSPTRTWEPAKLTKKNVVLLFVDSARRNVADESLDGVPAMPTLRDLRGQRLELVAHRASTGPSIKAVFNSTIDENRPTASLIDRFRALGYSTGIFSGQHEGFSEIARTVGMDRADKFVHAADFPTSDRMYLSSDPGAIAVPAPMANAAFSRWLGSLDSKLPFFAYLNYQELHFPYHYIRGPAILIDRPIPRHKISASNRDWVRRTYLNAAKNVDNALAELISILERKGVREETVLFILGDHGEELFEHGFLGHGTNLSYEQNSAFCKLVNSDWQAPNTPIANSQLARVIYNVLIRNKSEAERIEGEALTYVGSLTTPKQIGIVRPSGMAIYDFVRQAWLGQKEFGGAFYGIEPQVSVTDLWESAIISVRNSATPR